MGGPSGRGLRCRLFRPPWRIMSLEARAPRTRLRAPATMDFPAPVSPVIAFKAAAKIHLDFVDEGEILDADSLEHRRRFTLPVARRAAAPSPAERPGIPCFPAGPNRGEPITSILPNPNERASAQTSSITCSRMVSSRTTPPLPTCSLPASNWGLMRTTPHGFSPRSAVRGGKTRRREMKEQSAVKTQGRSGIWPGFRWRMLQRSITTTRGSWRSFQASCPYPTSTA